MTDLSALKFFSTPTHPCSYLEEQEARTLFADPEATMNPDIYGTLTLLGFRRSGNYLYRPHCEHCQACIPVRIPVHLFSPSRRHRRIWKKNRDLEVEFLEPQFRYSLYHLYSRYIDFKHRDGDMYPPSPEQFQSFLLSDWASSQFVAFKKPTGQIIAVAVIDEMPNGLSAVYTFYEPDEAHRSLGIHAVLWQIEHAKSHNLGAVYLGYWIKESPKMRYKEEFQPLQAYRNNRWEWLNEPAQQ